MVPSGPTGVGSSGDPHPRFNPTGAGDFSVSIRRTQIFGVDAGDSVPGRYSLLGYSAL